MTQAQKTASILSSILHQFAKASASSRWNGKTTTAPARFFPGRQSAFSVWLKCPPKEAPQKNMLFFCVPHPSPAAQPNNTGKKEHPSASLPFCLQPPPCRPGRKQNGKQAKSGKHKKQGKRKVKTAKHHQHRHLRRMEFPPREKLAASKHPIGVKP